MERKIKICDRLKDAYCRSKFEGEYKDGEKYKEKEYYYDGDLKFEGESKMGNIIKGKNIIIVN